MVLRSKAGQPFWRIGPKPTSQTYARRLSGSGAWPVETVNFRALDAVGYRLVGVYGYALCGLSAQFGQLQSSR